MEELYDRLKKYIQEEGQVYLSDTWSDEEDPASGYFKSKTRQLKLPYEEGKCYNGEIYIKGNLEIKEKIFILAHEYGHFLSYKDKRSPSYEEIINNNDYKNLNDEEKDIVLKEEENAWENGKSVLKSLGVIDFCDFDIRVCESINIYKNIMDR